MAKKKINARQVRDALLALAEAQPDRIDRRAASGELIPVYVEKGLPACIAAQVMFDLGIPIGMIKQLDRELSGSGGVILRLSENILRRRFTSAAWMLLDEVQRENDSGRSWGGVVSFVLGRGENANRRYYRFAEEYPWVIEIEALGG